MIRTIHFIYGLWDNKDEIPDNYRDNLSSWIRLNPTWKVKVWNKEMIKELINTIDDRKWNDIISNNITPIQYCDIARILVIYSEGGVYSDLDVVPKIPLDGLNILNDINNNKCVVGVEFPYQKIKQIVTDNTNRKRVRIILKDTRTNKLKWKTVPGHHLPKIRNRIAERLPRICNYFFASCPGHIYLKNCLDLISDRIHLPVNIEYDILYTTGPDIFSEALAMNGSKISIRIVPCHMLRKFTKHQCSGTWRWQSK